VGYRPQAAELKGGFDYFRKLQPIFSAGFANNVLK
jgi:hypothetical protein